MAMGGAGIAQAQSLGSLTGSLGSADVELTVASDAEGVAGEVTNNTKAALTCGIVVMDAGVMKKFEAAVVGGDTVTEAAANLKTEIDASNAAGKNAGAVARVPAGETKKWTGDGSYDPVGDPNSGAVAVCGEGEDQVVAFAFESTGLFGSLDMGSLGS